MKINDDGGDDDKSWKLTFVPFMKLLIITYFSKQTQLIFWTYYIQSDCDYSREMWNEDNGKSDIPRNLIVSRIWSWQEIYKARNTENKPKQIHTAVSRNLIVSAKPPLTLRAILDTLWWSWVKKSFPTSIEMYVGGLIYQEKLVATSFQWAEALQRFCSRAQGVVALVSVSDGKIQITILILRRGPCLIQTTVGSDFSVVQTMTCRTGSAHQETEYQSCRWITELTWIKIMGYVSRTNI